MNVVVRRTSSGWRIDNVEGDVLKSYSNRRYFYGDDATYKVFREYCKRVKDDHTWVVVTDLNEVGFSHNNNWVSDTPTALIVCEDCWKFRLAFVKEIGEYKVVWKDVEANTIDKLIAPLTLYSIVMHREGY